MGIVVTTVFVDNFWPSLAFLNAEILQLFVTRRSTQVFADVYEALIHNGKLQNGTITKRYG
jgi:hypothetical protein